MTDETTGSEPTASTPAAGHTMREHAQMLADDLEAEAIEFDSFYREVGAHAPSHLAGRGLASRDLAKAMRLLARRVRDFARAE